MTIGKDASIAARGGALRTPPNKHETESVTTSNATLDLADYGAGNADLRGKWVFFSARGGNVTLRRFTVGSEPTLVAGTGYTIADGTTEELFVPTTDSGGETDLRVIGSASCNLDADYSDD